jgi:HK97 family phage major capsid protein
MTKFNEVLASWNDATDSDVQGFYQRAEAVKKRLTPMQQQRAEALAQGDHAEADRIDRTVHGVIQAAKSIMDNQDDTRAPAKAVTHSTVFSSHKAAYDMGQWIRASFAGSVDAQVYCHRHGLINAAMTTGVNPQGGFLVPDALENAIIELREQYGMFRANATNVTMSEGKITLPRLAGEVVTYFVGEASDITASDMTVNSVTLDAKKLATLTTMSSELSEDSVVSIADMLARSIAYSFAKQEDECGFNGDGTSTYGGIVGLAGALQAGSKVIATSDQTFADLIIGNFESVAGKAKVFGANRKWYFSNAGYYASMQRLANAQLGATAADLTNGTELMFMGYPVVLCQVLESRLTGTSGAIAGYFGDLQAGAYLGTRRGISIALDQSKYFEKDMLALRATQRFDINIHDRGDATNSGGLVALVFG